MRDPARTAFGAAHVSMPSDDRTPANGPVITYQLSPEELAKYRTTDKPITTTKEGTDVPSKLTKEQYLLAVSEGKTDAQIAAEVGWTVGTLNYYRSKWQLTRTFTESPAAPETQKIPPFDFAVYENMCEEGKSHPEIARYFGMGLIDLKSCVALERMARVPKTTQPLNASEQRTEPLNDADKANVPQTVENATDTITGDHGGIQYSAA